MISPAVVVSDITRMAASFADARLLGAGGGPLSCALTREASCRVYAMGHCVRCEVRHRTGLRRYASTRVSPPGERWSGDLPFVEPPMKLTRGDLTDPAEAEHVGHVIGLPPLLVC